METKIIINGNKVIFEGHAGNTEECRTLSAMCEVLNASDNFNTIKLESGYAEFEQVAGGETMIFTALEAQVQALQEAVAKIKSCTCDPSNYATASEFERLEEKVDDLEEEVVEIIPAIETSGICVDLEGATITFAPNVLNDIATFQQLATDFYNNNTNLFTLYNGGYKLGMACNHSYCQYFIFYLNDSGNVSDIKYTYYSSENSLWNETNGLVCNEPTWIGISDWSDVNLFKNPAFIEFISKCCSIKGGERKSAFSVISELENKIANIMSRISTLESNSVDISNYYTKPESDANYAKASDVIKYTSLEGATAKFRADVLNDTANFSELATDFYKNNIDLFIPHESRDYANAEIFTGVKLSIPYEYGMVFKLDSENNVTGLAADGGDGASFVWYIETGVVEGYFEYDRYSQISFNTTDSLYSNPAVINFFEQCCDIEGGISEPLSSLINEVENKVTNVETKVDTIETKVETIESKPKCELPYTASELLGKLAKL